MTTKVLSPEEALKAFMSKGNVKEIEGVANFNPNLRLQNEQGIKFYVQGILLSRREKPSSFDPKKTQAIYTLKLISTNAAVSVRVKKDEYKDIEATPGMDVDIWSTTTLEGQLKSITPGNEVFIQYVGKAAKAEKGRQRAHIFKVIESPNAGVSQVAENESDAPIDAVAAGLDETEE